MSTSVFPTASEYEPLIQLKPGTSNDSLDLNTASQINRSYRVRSILLLISTLIIAAVIIYIISIGSHSSSVASPDLIRIERPHPNRVPNPWKRQRQCDDEHFFTLTLAIKLQNTEQLDDLVASVSDPASDTFHQYWTPEQVRAYFRPSEESINAVLDWLGSKGFTQDNGRVSMGDEYGNSVKVSLTCSEANDLLNTEYFFFKNEETDKDFLNVGDGAYSMPTHVHSHVDFITPSIIFPPRHHTFKIESHGHKAPLGARDRQRSGRSSRLKDDSDEIEYNDPERLFDLYLMNDAMADILGNVEDIGTSNRQAVLSLIDQYYSDSDLEVFEKTFSVEPVSVMERVPITQPQGDGSEAELDTQYITSTGRGMYTYVYYVDDDEDPFLGFSQLVLESDVAPNTVSISYGASEYELGETYVLRCNDEFGKLALIGTTILASSGDSGTRGDDEDCLDGTEFIGAFPASSPYVTAVGGAQDGTIPENADASTGEIAWEYSGGGFSSYFDTPSWQQSAVEDYLNNDEIVLPDSARYVSTGRAYPDIAAQSVNYIVAIDGEYYVVAGTSASSPTVAGMISMINYARVSSGKTSLGFLNPVLYGLYTAQNGNYDYYFNDVIEGYNIGCEVDGDIGFYAADGWDPVSGVGTPKFERLYQALLDV